MANETIDVRVKASRNNYMQVDAENFVEAAEQLIDEEENTTSASESVVTVDDVIVVCDGHKDDTDGFIITDKMSILVDLQAKLEEAREKISSDPIDKLREIVDESEFTKTYMEFEVTEADYNQDGDFVVRIDMPTTNSRNVKNIDNGVFSEFATDEFDIRYLTLENKRDDFDIRLTVGHNE